MIMHNIIITKNKIHIPAQDVPKYVYFQILENPEKYKNYYVLGRLYPFSTYTEKALIVIIHHLIKKKKYLKVIKFYKTFRIRYNTSPFAGIVFLNVARYFAIIHQKDSEILNFINILLADIKFFEKKNLKIPNNLNHKLINKQNDCFLNILNVFVKLSENQIVFTLKKTTEILYNPNSNLAVKKKCLHILITTYIKLNIKPIAVKYQNLYKKLIANKNTNTLPANFHAS